jgi:hypothetical protein
MLYDDFCFIQQALLAAICSEHDYFDMPICISGMHRSGTSLVASLLHECGLYLGREEDLLPAVADDNANGYWEHSRFVELNDRLLALFGGGWANPPRWTEGWEDDQRLDELRIEAENLIREFINHEPWGWKDPRNALTFPFWSRLNAISLRFWTSTSPKLKTILCIRNPFEVALSLDRRGYAIPFNPLELWCVYNQRLLEATLPEDRIVTHYESFFRDPAAELQRLLQFLGMLASEDRIAQACGVVATKLRHQKAHPKAVAESNNNSEAASLYTELCREANFRAEVQDK